MMVGIVVGLVVTAGAILVVVGLMPARQPLATRLRLLYEPPGVDVSGTEVLRTRWTEVAVALAQTSGRSITGTAQDLRVTGRTMEQLAIEKLTGLLAGFLLPLSFWALTAALGSAPPAWLPVMGSIVLAPVLFFVPDLDLRQRANRRRAEFREHLTLFLSLVTQSLAGGSGVETALSDAARMGDAWSFTEIRRALSEAQLANESPWASMRRLGVALGIEEFEELASSVELSGVSGARVRDSLAAKAAGLVQRDLAEAEAKANAATENMAIPVGLMTAAFMIVIGFPAFYRVLNL